MKESNIPDTSRVYKAKNGTLWYHLGPSESIENSQRMRFVEEHDGQYILTDIEFYFGNDLFAELTKFEIKEEF
jgi:hypothetical protein